MSNRWNWSRRAYDLWKKTCDTLNIPFFCVLFHTPLCAAVWSIQPSVDRVRAYHMFDDERTILLKVSAVFGLCVWLCVCVCVTIWASLRRPVIVMRWFCLPILCVSDTNMIVSNCILYNTTCCSVKTRNHHHAQNKCTQIHNFVGLWILWKFLNSYDTHANTLRHAK